MNAQTKTQADPREEWREQIANLDAQIAAAEQAITDAQTAASAAAFEGGNTDKAVRDVAHKRDVLDALQSAQREAKRRLARAEEMVAERDRAEALARAQRIARKRLNLAAQIDEYLSALDPVVADYLRASAQQGREMAAAGLVAPSPEKLSNPLTLRAAVMVNAPAFAARVALDRVDPQHRGTLRDHVARQVAPLLSKGQPK